MSRLDLHRNGGIHLVGSVPLGDCETVLRSLGAELGPWLARLPDGETGPRAGWIGWQRQRLGAHPDFEIDDSVPPLAFVQWDGKLLSTLPGLRLREGVASDAVVFDTGYAAAALASYATFERLAAGGAIPAGVRFQVSLPTPMSVAFLFVSPKAFAAFVPIYERALTRDLEALCAHIPHERLAVQWDVCLEVLALEGYFAAPPPDCEEQVLAQLARLGAHVPSGVELGYHLCYGSPRDEPVVMAKDLGTLVRLARGFVPRLARRLDFLHMPVMRGRSDEAYFAPLGDLTLPPATRLYLGLVHGDAGDAERIAVARRFVPSFGVASECGWGRRAPERVPELIAAHRRAAEAVSA